MSIENIKMQVLWMIVAVATASAALVTCWIAYPINTDLEIAAPMQAWAGDGSKVSGRYAKDLEPLATGFRPQIYRSFCGPASIATVLRAYGVDPIDQTAIFPSLGFKLNTSPSAIIVRDMWDLRWIAINRSRIGSGSGEFANRADTDEKGELG